MSTQFTELQLDALRELANIGSGTASTALSSMLGRSVDISVPTAEALPFADAVDAIGPAERVVTGVVIGVHGDMAATVLLLLGESDAATLCGLLGVDPADELAASALGEIGNIVGASYVNALSAMTGLTLEPEPPQSATDMLAAIVATVLAGRAAADDIALVLDSDLRVEGEDCSMSFLLVPSHGGVQELLTRLGLGD
ncbi:MAG TPA: chemotaxis protein CheC [Solirubrobacteraceae bacterium]|nr:chemotaxis protein CheC [Solirubrobacteraceae bacterium]